MWHVKVTIASGWKSLLGEWSSFFLETPGLMVKGGYLLVSYVCLFVVIYWILIFKGKWKREIPGPWWLFWPSNPVAPWNKTILGPVAVSLRSSRNIMWVVILVAILSVEWGISERCLLYTCYAKLDSLFPLQRRWPSWRSTWCFSDKSMSSCRRNWQRQRRDALF